MALRLRPDDRRGERTTLGQRRVVYAAIALVVIGLALIVFASESLPAVIGGILAITAAAFLALRG